MIRVGAKELREKQAELLDTAQREPITIERHGRPVAVIYSYEEAKILEKARLVVLRSRIAQSDKAIQEGRVQSLDQNLIEQVKSEGRDQLAENQAN